MITGWFLPSFIKWRFCYTCLMYRTGFNVQDGIQSWVSYTIPQNTFKTNLTQLIWRLDMRLRKGDLSICDRLNITNDSVLLAPLFFPSKKKLWFSVL